MYKKYFQMTEFDFITVLLSKDWSSSGLYTQHYYNVATVYIAYTYIL